MIDANDIKSLGELESEYSSEIAAEIGTFRDEPDYLQQRYIMVLGTDNVWDNESSQFMKASYLRLAAPNSFPIWHKSPSREIIGLDKIVFDPAKLELPGMINRFTGLDVKRKKGDCSKILNHLSALCGDDAETYDWICKWIAYPLQNPGAKMRTALVFHSSREGTGKNVFWDAITAIYGKYGLPIGQSQIEDSFNDWMSGKLFILANEVLSRRERRQIKGKLKALISEDYLMIRAMQRSAYQERNYANIVFLSNELDPVDTDQYDRRFMVINCEEMFDKNYFTDLCASIDISAMYDYFMSLDLGDFGPHTKPILTEAKRNLININARSEQRFIIEWLAGDTPYPVCPVRSLDLYWAYRTWCEEQGEHSKVTATAFGRWAAAAGLKRGRPSLFGTTKKTTVYFPGEESATVSECNFFEFEQILRYMGAKYPTKT